MSECPTCKGTGTIELPPEQPRCDNCNRESLYSYYNPISKVKKNLCHACLDELRIDVSAEKWIEKEFAKPYPVKNEETKDG